jgi:hypothetical protein
MASFLDHHKVIARNTFSTFSGAWNETESKGGIEIETLKCQFSQLKGDLNLEEMLKSVFIKKKNSKEKSSCDILCLYSSILIHCVVKVRKKKKKVMKEKKRKK